MPTATPEQVSAAGRLANLSRRLSPDDPRILDARREHAEARLAAVITRIAASAPPLRPAQIDRLREILAAAAAPATDSPAGEGAA